MPKTNFLEYFELEAKKTRLILAEYLDAWIIEWQTLDPTFTQMVQKLRPYLLTGGKWGRPLMTRLAYDLIGGTNEQNIYLGSVATEVWHRFILCHDDVIDGDLTRHGRATLEKEYQTEQDNAHPFRPMKTYALAMAMESGDLIHALAYQIVLHSGYDPLICNQVIRGFINCAHDTIAGWRLESLLKQQKIAEINPQQVTKAMKLVSAQYSVVWPLRIGQLFAGKQLGQWHRGLEKYGLNVGMAFQIQDDLLGIFGEPKKTGKPAGNDLREGKKSLVLLEGYKRATKQERKILEQANGGLITASLLDQVQHILTATGAVDWAKQEAKQYASLGVKALPTQTRPIQLKAGVERLEQLAYFLAEREA